MKDNLLVQSIKSIFSCARVLTLGCILCLSVSLSGATGDGPVFPKSQWQLSMGKETLKYQPLSPYTFLTVNTQLISYYNTGKFFQLQNMSYGFKIGTMKYAGWYLSAMSNFNFKGAFRAASPDQVSASPSSTSYLEALLGLTSRHNRAVSFHIGAGYFYKTQNYALPNGGWGHILGEVNEGPVLATGLMFHMGGFVLSTEAVVNYNVHTPVVKQGFGFGAKVGIGFCVQGKKKSAAIKDEKVETEETNLMYKYPLHPQTDGPVIIQDATVVKWLTTQEIDSIKANIDAIPVNEGLKSNPVEKTEIANALNAEKPIGPKATDTVQVFEEQFVIDRSSADPVCFGGVLYDANRNTYHTVAIGNQCWMKENLRVTAFSNGKQIQLCSHAESNVACRYYPNNDSTLVGQYGYLYNWAAVSRENNNESVQGRMKGICPKGWHVPSTEDWGILFDYLTTHSDTSVTSNPNNIAKSLASTMGWSKSNVQDAIGNQLYQNNLSGFSALPAGSFFGQSGLFGKETSFWSSSASDARGKTVLQLHFDSPKVQENGQRPVAAGFSVRCLKDY